MTAELTIRSDITEMKAIEAFLERFTSANNVSATDHLRLMLVLEELLSNTVLHGHGHTCDEPVCITLKFAPGNNCATMIYEDTCAVYDPFSSLKPLPENASADEILDRGFGVSLTMGIMDNCRHQPLPKGNRLTLTRMLAMG